MYIQSSQLAAKVTVDYYAFITWERKGDAGFMLSND